MSERVQKVLANAGLGSRRQLEEWVKSGRVKINGKIAVPGDGVESGDKVYIDNRRVAFNFAEPKTRKVLVYHKKEGEVCTRSDPEGRPTVFENLPPIKSDRWVTVGRLDINTSGLLLCTNDGELAHKLMHPSYEVPREYAVRVRGEVTPEMIKILKKGVLLDDGLAKFNDISFSGGENQNRWYHVVLLEGRNREVRRLFESQGVVVNRLKRVRFGTIVLTQKVRQGKFVELNDKEIKTLDEMLSHFESSQMDNSELTSGLKSGLKPIAKSKGASKNNLKNTPNKTAMAKSSTSKSRSGKMQKPVRERKTESKMESKKEKRPRRNFLDKSPKGKSKQTHKR